VRSSTYTPFASASAFRPDGDLLHVAVGTLEEDVGLGNRDDRERARSAGGGDARAFERVERHLGGDLTGADPLANVEHLGLLLRPFADHDRAANRDRVEGPTHGLDGGLIGAGFVATPHEARRRERRRLRDACHLECEVPIHLVHLRRDSVMQIAVHRRPSQGTPTKEYREYSEEV
jgi:hypothetical protein